MKDAPASIATLYLISAIVLIALAYGMRWLLTPRSELPKTRMNFTRDEWVTRATYLIAAAQGYTATPSTRAWAHDLAKTYYDPDPNQFTPAEAVRDELSCF
jgi:hypothetical protein